MRRRKTCFLLGVSCFLAALLAGVYCYQIYMDYRVPVPSSGRVLSVPIVENLDFLEGKERRVSPQNPGVYFGGALLPYAADGVLYLAQNAAVEQWEGALTTGSRESFLCTLAEDAWQDKAGSIRDNHDFRLWLVEEDCYYELSLVVSGMPVMNLVTKESQEQDMGDYDSDPDHFYNDPDMLYYGELQVFNPGVGVSRYEILEAGVRYYLRGTSSAVYKKKSYSISLLDAKGDKLDTSLLGMRSDNTWKLKAMAADDRRIRERAACQIWEKFALSNEEVNETGPRMEYLELILDNDYVGLYGLVEPVDQKKLGLDKNDVLYKFTDWMVPEDEDIQYAIDHRWRIMSFIRIRYPDTITDYARAWYPGRDYLNTFYHGAGDGRPAEDKVYLSNAVDILLFNMAVSGSDNFYKNIYYAADVSETGAYTMRQIPWDLDLTFGAVYGGGFEEDETVLYEAAPIPLLRDTRPELIRPYLQERWELCRETFLDTGEILELLRANRDYLLDTGVVERENERWPDYRMYTELTRIEAYQERRMEWLDSYFAGY